MLGRHVDKSCASGRRMRHPYCIGPLFGARCSTCRGTKTLDRHGHPFQAPAPLEARPSAISGAAASSSSSCFAQASAFQISRYSPAPITTQGPARRGVLDQRLGDADAPGRIELLVKGAAVEAAAQAARVLAEGAVRREEAVGELLELVGRVHPDAGVEAFGENDAVGERCAEPRGNREAILGVEAVLVETPECHPSVSFRRLEKRVRTGVMRWEEPHHPGPGLQLERHSTPLPPTLQHRAKQMSPAQLRLQRQGRLGCAR